MRKVDLLGKTINNFKVIRGKSRQYPDGTRRWVWLCQCVCGKIKWITGGRLNSPAIAPISCGCKRGKHNQSYTYLYLVWKNMLGRCRNRNNPGFHSYGGRGIKVCSQWYDFANFYADMGDRPAPNYSIERIDNDGNYEPTNCRWATSKEQAYNRRTTKLSDDKVKEIRHLYAEGASRAKIVEWYGVSKTTVFDVLAGTRWS